MSRINLPSERFELDIPDLEKPAGFGEEACEGVQALKQFSYYKMAASAGAHVVFHADWSSDWAAAVPGLIEKISSDVAEKKKQEIRFHLIEVSTFSLTSRVEKLEQASPRIVPINTFVPEPYELLKPILVSVKSTGDDFEAGWFDANIHTAGENEEEAVSNLKSLILDYYDSLSKESDEKLGPEPKRQLAVLKAFLKQIA